MRRSDKCPACGAWTAAAAEAYGGRYANGDELDVCECDPTDLQEEWDDA